MSRQLTQQEIDSIVNAQRGAGSGAAVAPSKIIHNWSAAESGRLSKEHARSLSTLHEGFARNLTHTLGAYVRVEFAVTMASVEQFTFEDFLASTPELIHNVAFHMEPFDVRGLLQLDHSLVFPMVDVLLGGSGATKQPERRVSEIEDQIISGVCRVICSELQAAWAPVGVQFILGDTQPNTKVQRFMPLSERIIVLSFEVTVLSSKGTMNLILPLSMTNSILRKMAHDWSYHRPRSQPDSADRLRARLMKCEFRMELGIPSIRVPARELLSLRVGSVLPLKIPVRTPASVLLDSREVFEALPVRVGTKKAAQIGGPATLPMSLNPRSSEAKKC